MKIRFYRDVESRVKKLFRNHCHMTTLAYYVHDRDTIGTKHPYSKDPETC